MSAAMLILILAMSRSRLRSAAAWHWHQAMTPRPQRKTARRPQAFPPPSCVLVLLLYDVTRRAHQAGIGNARDRLWTIEVALDEGAEQRVKSLVNSDPALADRPGMCAAGWMGRPRSWSSTDAEPMPHSRSPRISACKATRHASHAYAEIAGAVRATFIA